ncbi:hypothetical protein DOM21_15015 [Bacteriovorax stolpii]|uniref:hypothetical protein n=1 Tax=Bacteriovorax stolpii TaxID=960 RepID=UPI00115C1D2C|nr:hypothetical protein [Bacteriovorax stolpii]QDK42737.1 hypothetical protein DOM21_15015 [Bacteriovorax stolpii]
MEATNLKIWTGLLNSLTKPTLLSFVKDEMQFEVSSELNKEDLVKFVIKKISEDEALLDLLTDYMNDLEAWGRQHIFLYRSDPKDRASFRELKEKDLNKMLADSNINLKLNEYKSIFIPEKAGYEIYQIDFEEDKRFTVFWVQRKIVRARLDDEDFIEGDIEYHAWGTYVARGLLILDWNLATGQMMIRITQAETKDTYDVGKKYALQFLNNVMGISIHNWNFQDIRKSIAHIKDSGEVSTKKYNQETLAGGKQSLQARDKNTGVEKDAELNQASKVLKDKYASTYGNFFWLEKDDKLDKEIHTTIDSNTRSLIVFGLQDEETVRYIIGRIIHYSN